MPRHLIVPLVLCAAVTAAAALAISNASGAGGAQTSSTNPASLPVGDGRYSTSGPDKGTVYLCRAMIGPGGASVRGPWFKSDGTYDSTAKPTVDGAVNWPQAYVALRRKGRKRIFRSNGLPTDHSTGEYPIRPGDDAFAYDRNPNSIRAQSFSYALNAKPRRGAARCIGGEVGVARNGVPIFNAFDAALRDANAWEIQDACNGHPQMSGSYHYHSIPDCLYGGQPRRRHSRVVGYALDGFPIHGPRGSGGRLLDTADLDACHGHTHRVKLDGERLRSYHYHATLDFPYTVSCFRAAALQVGPG